MSPNTHPTSWSPYSTDPAPPAISRFVRDELRPFLVSNREVAFDSSKRWKAQCDEQVVAFVTYCVAMSESLRHREAPPPGPLPPLDVSLPPSRNRTPSADACWAGLVVLCDLASDPRDRLDLPLDETAPPVSSPLAVSQRTAFAALRAGAFNTTEVDVPELKRMLEMARATVEPRRAPAQPATGGDSGANEQRKSSDGHGVEEEATPRPRKYLKNWREILDCLDLKNNAENKRFVAEMNRLHNGPIKPPRRGGQPKAEKTKLLEWWNRLEIEWETQGRGGNPKATVEERYQHGKSETVVPEIAGHVKKRRGAKK